MTRLILALACLTLAAPVGAQTVPLSPWTVNPPVVVFPASAVNGAGVVSSPQLLCPDGTALLPSCGAFTSEPTLGFWRSSAANVTLQGALTATGNISTANTVQATVGLNITSKWKLTSPADGIGVWTNNGGTIGIEVKTDALPVASACGAGSPAVVAGSTPSSGSVTIGTTAVATCTITFGGTAWNGVPHCSGAVETVTAANARAMGYSATTTVLTIVPATAWADSSVVNWNCWSKP